MARTTARAAKKKAATKAPAAKTTAAEAVVEEVKEAVVKEVEEKKEKVVDADIKEVAAAAKETVKDTGAKVVDKAKEVTKKVEKTVKEKVAEVKAAVAEPEVYVQYQGNESDLAAITARIKKQYVEEGHKESDIKSLKIYLKPEDASAYYVINDNNSGKVADLQDLNYKKESIRLAILGVCLNTNEYFHSNNNRARGIRFFFLFLFLFIVSFNPANKNIY